MYEAALVLIYLYGTSDGAGPEAYEQERFKTQQQCEERMSQQGKLLPFNQTLICKPVEVKV